MLRYVIPLAILAVAIYLLLPGSGDTSEIETMFNEMLEAGREKDRDSLMDNFSLYYKDEYGLSYPAIRQIISKKFENFDSFDGKYSSLSASFGETENGDKQALVNLDITVYGIKGGVSYALLGSEDAPENLTLTLEKSTFGGWKIKNVSGLDSGNYEY